MSALRRGILLAAGICLAGSNLAVAPAAASLPPEPPRTWSLETDAVSAGAIIAVPEGGDLQAALDRARPGDQITLEPGATYMGPFTLPKKTGDSWILLRGRDGARIPPRGARVNPSHAAAMPKLVSSSSYVVIAAAGAHHYRFVGIEMCPTPGSRLVNLVQLGAEESVFENFPHHIILERCYLHGDPREGTRRGVAMNSRFTAVIDSFFSDFMENGGDSQAIAGWAGPGPYSIVNNHLEAAGENIMFGGGDPAIDGLVPSDIEIRRNHLTKPLRWKEAGSSGAAWTVKNLLELKNARRVVIEGNLLEHNWAQAQSGFAVLFTVRNQDGTAPWSVVSDVRFVNNIVRHAAGGINFLGRDDAQSNRSAQTSRLAIQNCLFDDIGPSPWGGAGVLFQVLNGTADIIIENVTAIQSGAILFAEGPPHTGFVYRQNVSLHNEYGVSGTGTGPGLSTLKTYFPAAVFEKNLLVGGDSKRYPPGNRFPDSPASVRFVDFAGGCYRLQASSQYRGGGIGGRDPGADLRQLCSALAPVDLPHPLCDSACLGSGTR